MRSPIRVITCQMDVVTDAMLHEQHNKRMIEKTDGSSFDIRFPVFHQGPLELFLKWLLEFNIITKDLNHTKKMDDMIREHRSHAQGTTNSRFEKALAERQVGLSENATLQTSDFNSITTYVIRGFR